MVQRLESSLNRSERRIRISKSPSGKLGVTQSHGAKGVVVEPRPDMKAVLLDPTRLVHIAATRSLAAEPPAKLIERYLVFRLPVLGLCHREGGRDCPDATSDNRYFLRPPYSIRHEINSWMRIRN
jgi:hypothetical protein